MADIIFADGARFTAMTPEQKEKTPWIKGKLSFQADQFCEFLQKHKNEKGWVNVDMKFSEKSNSIYLALNSWKPKSE